jgi:very-short-patch-repair endonuclease
VVSPFRGQVNRIHDLITQNDLLARSLNNEFLVETVHRFQGDERDVMIFSPTISQGTTESARDFLRHYPNLFNVAITRARAALVVIGDRMEALSSNVDYLSKFVDHVSKITSQQKLNDHYEEPVFGPEYPAVARPELVSDWEKILYRKLFQHGIRTIPQYSVEKYLLDFACINNGRRLNIEVDGEMYHRNWNGELRRVDQIRNHRLMELGWDVMRFWVYQIRDDMSGCIARVKQWIDKK